MSLANLEEYSTTLALCKGILFKLANDGYKIGGFDAYIESEIPDGSGVSSSAAIESLFGYIISYLYTLNTFLFLKRSVFLSSSFIT